MQWTGTILKEGHIRIIPPKFGQNPACSLGSNLKQLLTTDKGHPMITIAHHELMAKVSLKVLE